LVAQGQTLVEQLVGMAISGNACEGTVTLLHNEQLSPAQARQIMADLEDIEYFSGIGDSIDHMERASFLNAVVLLAQGKMDEESLKSVGFGNLAYSKYLAIDWNVALEKGNAYYDGYAAAARLPTRAARKLALAQLENELNRISTGFAETDSIVAAVLSRSARSDTAATVMISLLLPALNATIEAQDRQNTTLDLTRLAAALAVCRAEHGAYPRKLDDLVPTVLKKLPVDLYNSKPFIYQRKDDGYLLYSAGENGADDGASNAQRNVFEGYEYAPDDQSNSPPKSIPAGADDISIRVPRLPLKMPAHAAP
jgi:hypothetical protein